ncbi:sugar/nucleoside kinase (ribokinase family) [Cricetibacter osteomyelitidis]|uniref:Sugar/nucleoside kinase (Ribokinase family) n=1 Tax=Cricetibacter osteomyelitidis TaxID=1521931 RepID=A0A4R2T8M1_9PAST|nr:adenosine kinase [Cricetibacter osteomyelitidis]TCP91242.1 sugar/nucleoside kinase (ribokinase family) [Cricetibacter osteomyelitidis]
MQERNGILAAGNLLIDKTLVISEYPKESMLATISKIEQHCGGGCTNVLFNLAILAPDLPLFLSGAVGRDAEGDFILEQARKHHIDTKQVVQTKLPTSFTDVMINSQSGDRTFFHYVGAMTEYLPEHLMRVESNAKIVHIAYLPLLPAFLELEQLISLLKGLQQKGFLISIDLVSVENKTIFTDYIRPILPYIDFAIINDVEAKILADMENAESNKDNLEIIAQKIMQFGVKQNVIVHYPQWAVACDQQGQVVSVPSYWVEKHHILSTLGAGDAFCSGVLYGLHQNKPLREVLQLGHGLAYFNLFSLSATDGAVPYDKLKQHIDNH